VSVFGYIYGMDTYSAVVTTGIYCRPGCAARPDARNVRSFELAAAAEGQGFRACHRCRPYRAPAPAVRADSELVCRAVQLIVAGDLDGRVEAELAARLGVSARHLRLLFVAELGVTPDGLARSRRAHFARRLLDDTDLSVAEVAYASGFGSLRQFNRVCREVFHAPPLQLRARRRRSDRLAADGGLVLRLPFEGSLDWDALIEYLTVRAIPAVEHVTDDGIYRRTITVEDDPGVIELWPGGDDHLLLRAHLPHWEGLIHLVDRAGRIAGLDTDLAGAVRDLGADPQVGPLLASAPGIRPPGTWNAFEIGVRAILGQQITVTGATTLAGRLVERYGTTVAGLAPLGLSRTFPEPSVLADADLTGIGLPTARAAAIRAFAQAVVHDEVHLDRSVGLDQLVAEITAIPGLGPWTAHYIALRLGEPDAFPASDLGLRRAIAPHQPPTTAELQHRAEAWRPWRAHIAARLWMTADPARRAA
jgi:AraC family transcriptional regulator, regulatory protein of adaptative response / DNA-3-methyladenine glycosylase II